MGSLRNFNIGDYISKFNLTSLIETGTYKGDSIEYAMEYNFVKIFSIELLEEFYKYSLDKFSQDKRIILINDNSIDGLKTLLTTYVNIGNTLYWLDAHLPNLYKDTYDSNYKENNKILIPLKQELKLIKKYKDITNDVFIIDDLRIYETGNFAGGEWLDVITEGMGGIDEIYTILDETHDIIKIYDNEGYILCTPKIKN